MDLDRYTFQVYDCVRHLDKIEARLGVKFDRKAMFDCEQAIESSFHGGKIWSFTFNQDPTNPAATFSISESGEFGVRKCVCGHHIKFTDSPKGYPSGNALECSLVILKGKIAEIHALRQPKPQDKQMTTQDKETIMHETIARASLVAFAEFIGQPINDLDATFRQARALYDNRRSIACVVKIPVDKTKPIIAAAVDVGPIYDGLELEGDVVRVSYFLGGSAATNFRICAASMTRYAPEALKMLTTERAKQTPPPPAKPEPIPYEAECRAYVKRLNKELGINLNEDAVLAAGEVARATHPDNNRPRMNYVLSITKASRAASFAVLPASAEVKASDNVFVFSTSYYPSEDGLRWGLRWMEARISHIQSELTPPAPSKPALTADDMRPGSVALDRALETPRPPIYVFGGKESERQPDDNKGFFAALTSGATNLFLTFQRKADRAQLSKNPRVHVHISPTPFLPEFNTTISAPIDPANPAATLTALAERITTENL